MSTPKVALRLSALITTALTGSTTDPKARNIRISVAPISSPTISGRRWAIASRLSTLRAVTPPTSIRIPAGGVSARTPRTASRAEVLNASFPARVAVRTTTSRAEPVVATPVMPGTRWTAAVIALASGDRPPGPCSTTCTPTLLSAGKSASRVSIATRAGAPAGSCRSSFSPKCTCVIGRASTSSPATIGSATRIGTFSTTCERRVHPVPAARSARGLRRRTGNVSTRGPSSVRTAGSSVSDSSAASPTADSPPYARDFRKSWGNSSSPASAIISNVAEKTTVRPAVATVRRTASAGVRPKPCSSRNRPTMNNP